MSTLTKNLNFIKPEITDTADITTTNKNWDTLDDVLNIITNAVNAKKTPYQLAKEYGYTGTESAFYTELANISVPKIVQVTIPSTAWNTRNDVVVANVGVNGILADDTKQLVHAVPSRDSIVAAIETGVCCIGQGNNKLTFMCKTVPTVDLVFNVSYQNAVPG